MPLSPEDRERLAKLLAMFSSTFTGEILNAARAAERLVKARGETWESVIVFSQQVDPPPHRPTQPKPKPHRSAFQDEIDACMAKANFLTDWERNFLTSISDRWSLTEKQQARFDQIKAKVARYQDMDF
jgi:hypothetical protein